MIWSMCVTGQWEYVTVPGEFMIDDGEFVTFLRRFCIYVSLSSGTSWMFMGNLWLCGSSQRRWLLIGAWLITETNIYIYIFLSSRYSANCSYRRKQAEVNYGLLMLKINLSNITSSFCSFYLHKVIHFHCSPVHIYTSKNWLSWCI